MAKDNKTFNDYLTNLKKDELNAIVDNYNRFATIYNEKNIVTKGLKKEDIIGLIVKNKSTYVKYILSIINNYDRNEIEKGSYSKKIQRYLSKYKLLDEDNILFSDIKKTIDKLLKNSEFIKQMKNWDYINNIINGLIIAYGVVDTNYVKDILAKYCDYEQTLALLKLGTQDYSIEKKKIVSKLLTSRKRIDKYYSDNSYKEFNIKELQKLGTNKYHYDIKEYKKLMSILKNYYVFKRKDIKFIDENIVIPYLYISINEEDIAKDALMTKLEEYFEFREDKLKERLYKQVDGIRDNFPLWEYRGFSKKEVKK